MANWSDPWTTGAATASVGTRTASYDAGLRSYMLSVYNYMASGVLLTGIVALLFVNSPYMSLLFTPEGRASARASVSLLCVSATAGRATRRPAASTPCMPALAGVFAG